MAARRSLMDFWSKKPSADHPLDPSRNVSDSSPPVENGTGAGVPVTRLPNSGKGTGRRVRAVVIECSSEEGEARGGGGGGSKSRRKTQSKVGSRVSISKKGKALGKELEGAASTERNSSENDGLCASSSQKGSDLRARKSEKTTPRGRRRTSGNKRCKGEETPEKDGVDEFNLSQEKTSIPGKKTPRRRNGMKRDNSAVNGCNDQSAKASPIKVDLRLEEKMAAKENALLFVGKEMHPFFTRKHSPKKSLCFEACHLEGQFADVVWKGTRECPPIHVIQEIQEDKFSVDWQCWSFAEQNILNSNNHIAAESFDIITSGFSCQKNSNTNVETACSSPGGLCCQNLPNLGTCLSESYILPSCLSAENQNLESEIPVDASLPCGTTANKFSEELLQERIAAYQHRLGSEESSSLWVDKYRPESALEVCGNVEPVKFINEWLHCWRNLDFGPEKNRPQSCKVPQDQDCDWTEGADSEDDMDDVSLKNLLLVTGPVGCGKSAAIYACAKEQGFTIIEVNASDWRNGAILKQRLEASVDSRSLTEWSREDSDLRSRLHKKEVNVLSGVSDKNKNDLLECQQELAIPQVVTGAEAEVPQNAEICRDLNVQYGSKTMILFEDFDTISDEDHGFIAAVIQLAETAKRPIILTSNRPDPKLPHLLDRLMVTFSIPQLDELVAHAQMICMSEKVKVSYELILRIIRCCHGDIRKSITMLQLWCQGHRYHSPQEPSGYQSLFSDLDAGHHVLQKIIPLAFPCQMSEFIGLEICNTLAKVESDTWSIDEQSMSAAVARDNLHDFLNDKMDINAKKEVLLSRNRLWRHSLLDSPILSVHSSPDDAGTPAKRVHRPGKRRKLLLTSDSEDDVIAGNMESSKAEPDSMRKPFLNVSNGSSVMVISPNAKYGSFGMEFCPSVLESPQREKDCLNLCGSQEMSCFQELSTIPETEINGSMELGPTSSLPFSAGETLECNSNLLKRVKFNFHATDELERVSESILESTHEDAASFLGNHDSQAETTLSLLRSHTLMDECSRADFTGYFDQKRTLMRVPVVDLVQENWTKLRNDHDNVRSYLSTSWKDALHSLHVVAGFTDLLSSADMMLDACQNLEDDVADSCNQGLNMMNAFTEHGFTFHAKNCSWLRSPEGIRRGLDLPREMLVSGMSPMALGKLVVQEISGTCQRNNFLVESIENVPVYRAQVDPVLSSTLQSILPTRLRLSARGAAFHEYLSFLSQISKQETVRLAENSTRIRRPRHYLKTSAFSMSDEDVKILTQHGCYGKS